MKMESLSSSERLGSESPITPLILDRMIHLQVDTRTRFLMASSTHSALRLSDLLPPGIVHGLAKWMFVYCLT